MPQCCDHHDHQPFPQRGLLAERLTLDELRRRLSNRRGVLYSYVIRTIEGDADGFVQRGCAPNFQGGLVTLCTCKHRMRTYLDIAAWEDDKWIAGFSGVKVDSKHNALVYVMRVGRAYPSHYELWSSMGKPSREAKAAHSHQHGDVFRPRRSKSKPFDASTYEPPCDGHRHQKNNEWHKDIAYKGCGERYAAMLVGDRKNTFVWDRPTIFTSVKHGKGQRKWAELEDFTRMLWSEP